MNKLFLTMLFGVILIISCTPEDKVVEQYQPKGSYDSGVLVLNEGGFQAGNASVSFLSFDLNSTQNNIFSVANNNAVLGDTAQSICFKDDLAYIIMNGSNKIEVVNRYSMIKFATITNGIQNPRYMAIANGKGYVTNWGLGAVTTDDYVAIIDLSTNTVTNQIAVIEGPEQIIENSGKLFVSHKGGYGFGTTVSVISSTSNLVTNTIVVGDIPNKMQIENNSLWVLCEGNPNYVTAPLIESGGKLYKINLSTYAVESTFSFPTAMEHPTNLEIYNSTLYYTKNSGIYKMPLTPVAPATSISLPATPVFTSLISNLYGFAIKNNRIYISGYTAFDSNGTVSVYSLGELTDSPAIGTLVRSTGVGVGPNGFFFNQ